MNQRKKVLCNEAITTGSYIGSEIRIAAENSLFLRGLKCIGIDKWAFVYTKANMGGGFRISSKKKKKKKKKRFLFGR